MSELIDREDADYDLEKLQADAIIRGNRQYSHGIRDARKVIAGEPKVDSVVHGHWIFKDSTGGGFTEPIDTYICSKCGKVSEMSCAYISKDNFCKNCGAKMDEDTEREDNK